MHIAVVALLTVNDDEFWEGVSPLEFGELPALQDAVTVVGYPIGGDTISVTSGVVSRIEILSYVHGSTELLGLQVCTSFLFLCLALLFSSHIVNILCFDTVADRCRHKLGELWWSSL